MQNLKGKKGLVIGIANEHSIAWGCAKAFYEAGAELAITYLNDKAEPYVKPLSDQVKATIFLPLDVQNEDQMNQLFKEIEDKWGRLDFVLHSIAYAPKQDLLGRLVDSSLDGFLMAMDISCHSFLRIAKLSEPLMKKGGCLLTISYYGAEKVVENYDLMGPVKAALEACVRYAAAELGKSHIRVNAISSGAIATRAASGIAHFEDLLEQSRQHAPEHENIAIDSVGAYARFLVSDDARLVTGSTVYVDGGLNIMAL